MPFDAHCPLWPDNDEAYFRDRELHPRKQVGPTCVATTLGVLAGRAPTEFIDRMNTQDPTTWSAVLKPMGMQLAYCPTDVRRLKHYLSELLRLDDLFTLSYYTTSMPEELLGDPDEKGWVCGSHIVVMHRDRIYDSCTGTVSEARLHSSMEYHTKRIFRVVPAGHRRSL